MQEQGFNEAKLIVEAIKSKGVSKIGAAGFCWGGEGEFGFFSTEVPLLSFQKSLSYLFQFTRGAV